MSDSEFPNISGIVKGFRNGLGYDPSYRIMKPDLQRATGFAGFNSWQTGFPYDRSLSKFVGMSLGHMLSKDRNMGILYYGVGDEEINFVTTGYLDGLERIQRVIPKIVKVMDELFPIIGLTDRNESSFERTDRNERLSSLTALSLNEGDVSMALFYQEIDTELSNAIHYRKLASV